MKRLVSLLLILVSFCALIPAQADGSAEPGSPQTAVVAEDYFGYWVACKAEIDGMDITAEMLAYGEQGVEFNEAGAVLDGIHVSDVNGEVTVTPTRTFCEWVFQPDGSMKVLQPLHPLIFQHHGDYLLVDDQGVLIYYAPAASGLLPDIIAQENSFSTKDYVGIWKIAKVEIEGMDVTEEYLPVISLTMTLSEDLHALLHISTPAMEETLDCMWGVSPDGNYFVLNYAGQWLNFRISGEYLIAEESIGQAIYLCRSI